MEKHLRIVRLASALNITKGPLFIGPITLGLILYLVGLILSLFTQTHRAFISAWPTIVMIFAIVWVSSVACWADKYYPQTLQKTREVFSNKKAYDALTQQHLYTAFNDRRTLLASIPLFVLGTFILTIGPPESFRWKELTMPGFTAYYGLLSFLIAYLASAGIHMILEHIIFLRKLSDLPMKLEVLPIGRKTKLHLLASFSLQSCITWSVGVASFSLVVMTFVTPLTVLALISGIIVAIAFFFYPQFLLRNQIVRAKDELMASLGKRIAVGIRSRDENSRLEVLTVCTLFDHVEKIKEWPFELNQAFLAIGSSMLSVGITALRMLIARP